MEFYIMYNADVAVAEFDAEYSIIKSFRPIIPELLPMQLVAANADRFMAWLRDRAIDLNTLQHRNLVNDLWGSRDKVTLALLTHMYSVTDSFTCFPKDEFIPRGMICDPDSQVFVSRYILVSSDTSVRNMRIATPNISTDGSFPKTWEYEDGDWWLYKIQSAMATRCEVEISKILHRCGWDAAEYQYVGSRRTRVKTRNFVGADEFFEPYDSYRYAFANPGDDEDAIAGNIASLGETFESAWKRILLADAFFMNTDRHMRNFGMIRSSKTGKVLRMAPNFDNNQAFLANPSGRYSDAMLRGIMQDADDQMQNDLDQLIECASHSSFFEPIIQSIE